MLRKVVLCIGTWLALHTNLWDDDKMPAGKREGAAAWDSSNRAQSHLIYFLQLLAWIVCSLTAQVAPGQHGMKQKEQVLPSSTFLAGSKCFIKICCHYHFQSAWSCQERLDALLGPAGGSRLSNPGGKGSECFTVSQEVFPLILGEHHWQPLPGSPARRGDAKVHAHSI